MVRKKDGRTIHDWLQDALDRVERDMPIVDEKWSVEEVTPGYTELGYYGTHVPEHVVAASDRFDTRDEAEEWMNNHEADEGKYLAITKHVARQYTAIHWTSFRERNI
jgi:hypothetical protein